jgi:hypothetical protein
LPMLRRGCAAGVAAAEPGLTTGLKFPRLRRRLADAGREAPGLTLTGKLPMLCRGYVAAAPGAVVGGKLPALYHGYTPAAPAGVVGGKLPMLRRGYSAAAPTESVGSRLPMLRRCCPVPFDREFCRRHSV